MTTKLSWRHQTIIQALLSRGPLKENEFHAMFSGLTGKDPGTDQHLFKEYLLNINKALSFAHLELRGSINQYDGNVYFGVVNTVSDEQSKMGTKYTVPQIAFYKAIIEAIVQDPAASGVVSHFNALNMKLDSQITIARDSQSQENQHQVPSASRNFTMTMKEKTLDELVRDQWLNLTADGDVTLGVKTFLDLRSWFRNNDVPSCHVCNEAGVKADLCQNEACNVRIHRYCLKQLMLQRKGAKSCPSCGTEWPYTVPKSEAVQIEDENDTVSSQQAAGSRRQRHKRNTTGHADVVGADNRDELNELAASQRVTRSARQRHRIDGTGDADEVVPRHEDELNDSTGSQLITRAATKKRKLHTTRDADVVGTSAASSNLRRVTRSSARQV
ncbi:hypothetical protein L6164_029175 [Bauhinia variegata]|uniref:Uncharacterized protein n=1 Tax=Bauhinia variegata TaxID=167791 RepID=A0ACB9L9Q8_BAUVA|nr:hypothetical protein L6164_029175 [Bauhinia variegata]